uniref:Helitron helicase-like domain-containing protein n=1 Tax=Anopheles dirus TaxID=7168 RepID=A0A182N9L2_9DIPT
MPSSSSSPNETDADPRQVEGDQRQLAVRNIVLVPESTVPLSSRSSATNNIAPESTRDIPNSHLPLRQRWEAIRRDRLRRRYGMRKFKIGLGNHESYNRPERHPLLDREPCPEIYELFGDADFMRNIRVCNNLFAFTSMGASMKPNDPVRQDRTVAGNNGPCTYRIQGALCHRIGTLGRIPGHTPMYAQLYFYDCAVEEERHESINARVALSDNRLDWQTVSKLQNILDAYNPLAKLLQHAYERMSRLVNVHLRIHETLPGFDQHRHNQPTVDEVGGIFITTGEGQTRDIVLQYRSNCGLRRVYESHPKFDALKMVGRSVYRSKLNLHENTESMRELVKNDKNV